MFFRRHACCIRRYCLHNTKDPCLFFARRFLVGFVCVRVCFNSRSRGRHTKCCCLLAPPANKFSVWIEEVFTRLLVMSCDLNGYELDMSKIILYIEPFKNQNCANWEIWRSPKNIFGSPSRLSTQPAILNEYVTEFNTFQFRHCIFIIPLVFKMKQWIIK